MPSTKSTIRISDSSSLPSNVLSSAELAPLPSATLDGLTPGALTPVDISTALGTTAVPGSAVALTDSLYLTEGGTHTAINVADINQGQLGDCFLLSSIGELALYDPAAIRNMININANGTESVALFESPSGHTPGFGATAFSHTSQTVTNVFSPASVNNGATQDVVGHSKEIWAQVLEKAYAQANGGYSAISNGGNPCIALQQLTGHTAQWEAPAAATAASLATDVNAGDLIVMDTASTANLPYNLVSNHAYMFEGLVSNNGVTSVKLGNPWGFDQPNLIPTTQLAHSGIVEVDIGHV